MIKRLVGYFEYTNFLNLMTELSNEVSDLELEALDQYVQRFPYYRIRTNLASELENGPTSLSAPKSGPVVRKGLAWMLALARVELGTMLAGFSPTVAPFEAVGVDPYDIDAYKELLMDGVKSHYWALLNDPDLAMVLTAETMPRVLSYSRRLVMVRAMLRAVVKSSRDDLSAVQMQELYSWKESLDRIQSRLTYKIRNYLDQSTTTSGTRDQVKILSRYCNSILRAESREIQAGTADVSNVGTGLNLKSP